MTSSSSCSLSVHSFVKKTGKTPAGVLDLARRRMRHVADG